MPSFVSAIWSTVRGRIIALVVISVLAPLIGGGFVVSEYGNRKFEEIRERTAASVDDRIASEKRLIDAASNLLAILALLPELRQATPDHFDDCVRLLTPIPRVQSWTSGALLLSADGELICDSYGMRLKDDFRNREYVRKAITEKRLVVSESLVGKSTQKALLVVMKPILEEGRVVRLLALSIDMTKVIQETRHGLPEGGGAVILNQKGETMLSIAACGAGCPLAADPPVARLLAEPRGVVEDIGPTGERRLWAFADDGDGRVFASVTLMRPIVDAWRGFVWAGVGTLLLLGAIRFAVLMGLLQVSVLRWLKRLNQGVARVAGGERDTGIDPHRAPAEIGTVLTAFNDMANRIADRERDLVLARDEADRANRVKSDFLATMSHELRTPMNGLIGFAELILETPLNDEQRGFALNLRDAARHLLTVVNDVLDYSRLEAGLYDLRPVPLRVESLVMSCVALMQPLAEAKRLVMDVSITDEAGGMVKGDPDRLRQILLNLLGNALKFTDRGRISLAVTARRDSDGRLVRRFAVTDTGLGIPAERQGELFRKFVKLIPNRPGTGLGLAICQRIVTAMEGTIGLTSTPGLGSTFWFTVPLPEAPDEPAAEPSHAVPAGRGARILLVDDVAMNRDIAAEFLRKGGHRVDPVETGQRAIERASEIAYDLILMDVYMPGMDGVDATRAIRALPGAMGTVPIIAMTAGTGAPEIDRCLAAGMNGWLGKPIDRRRLLEEVERWADAQSRRLEERLAELLEAMGPDGMAELLRSFAEETEERLPSEFGPYDIEHLFHEGHAINAAAGNLGFEELADYGRLLAEAARDRDAAGVAAVIVPLRRSAERALTLARVRAERFAEEAETETASSQA